MKKRFIACVIACALLLMGTGYAYWTDLFTINGTVSTGNFEVRLRKAEKDILAITDADEWPADVLLSNQWGASLYSEASTSVSDINENTVSVTLNKIYPGYAQKYTFKADNIGTVAAKLSKIVLDKSQIPDELLDVIGISLKAKIKDYVYIIYPFGYGSEQDVANVSGDFSIRGESFASLRSINDIAIKDNRLFLDVKGEGLSYLPEMEIELVIGMNPDAKGQFTSGTWLNPNGVSNSEIDEATENNGGQLSLQFQWDQYNAHAAK